jgi:hypothetical protein
MPAAATMEELLVGIDEVLAEVPGLRHSAYEVDAINPPHAFPLVPDFDFYGTFTRGTFELEIPIWLLVSRTIDRAAMQTLLRYTNATGEHSLVSAFEANTTLGGRVQDCKLMRFRRLGPEEFQWIGHFGGEFTLLVLATGRDT